MTTSSPSVSFAGTAVPFSVRETTCQMPCMRSRSETSSPAVRRYAPVKKKAMTRSNDFIGVRMKHSLNRVSATVLFFRPLQDDEPQSAVSRGGESARAGRVLVALDTDAQRVAVDLVDAAVRASLVRLGDEGQVDLAGGLERVEQV